MFGEDAIVEESLDSETEITQVKPNSFAGTLLEDSSINSSDASIRKGESIYKISGDFNLPMRAKFCAQLLSGTC